MLNYLVAHLFSWQNTLPFVLEKDVIKSVCY